MDLSSGSGCSNSSIRIGSVGAGISSVGVRVSSGVSGVSGVSSVGDLKTIVRNQIRIIIIVHIFS